MNRETYFTIEYNYSTQMMLNIYTAHASSIDYKQEFYKPIKNSRLEDEHNIIYPHEDSDEPFDSLRFFYTECDLFIAEVSNPSTGLGIELGWAYEADIPIICLHKSNTKPTNALNQITKMIYSYESKEDMIQTLQENWKHL